MKKNTFYFNFQSCCSAILAFCLVAVMNIQLQAQTACELSCVSDNISIVPTQLANCESTVTLVQLLGANVVAAQTCATATGTALQTQRETAPNVWSPAVGAGDATISASDIGNRVNLRVIQYSTTTFAVLNSCWHSYLVEDKAPPVYRCAADQVITCDRIRPDGTIIGAVNGITNVSDCSLPVNIITTDYTFEASCTRPFRTVASDSTTLVPTEAQLQATIFRGINPLTAAQRNALRDIKTRLDANLAAVVTNDIVKIIVRCFLVTDAAGNVAAPCYQIILVRKGTIATVAPPAEVEYSCADAAVAANALAFPPATLPVGSRYPVVTFVGGGTAVLDPNAPLSCNIDASYVDGAPILLCTGSYKIIRTWTVLDWCGIPGRNIYTVQQVIKVLDKTPASVRYAFTDYATRQNGTYCTVGVNGGIKPNIELFAENRDGFFTGSFVQNRNPGPDDVPGTVVTINALGNAFDCGGSTTISLSAIDSFCTLGNLLLTSSDSRFAGLTGSFNSTTRRTTWNLSANYAAAGTYPVTFTIADACGYALAKQTFNVVVRDNIKPSPVCREFTQVALTNAANGVIRVQSSSFNAPGQGTYDNCRLDKIWVRRMTVSNASCDTISTLQTLQNPDACFFDYVDFNCGDVNDTVMVVLRSVDFEGNYNDCMIQVLVEDKVRPTCVAPANITVNCNDPRLNNIALFGDATYYDNCTATPLVVAPVINIDPNCKDGNIVRRFRVRDCSGLFNDANTNTYSCTQTITINKVSDFTVQFPNDVQLNCFASVATYDEEATKLRILNGTEPGASLTNRGCGVLSVNVENTVYTATPDACFKIFQKITVIDWCRYNPLANFNDCLGNNLPAGALPTRLFTQYVDPIAGLNRTYTQSDLTSPATNDGIVCYTRVIKVVDQIAPTLTTNVIEPCDYGTGRIGTRCAGSRTFTATGADLCAGQASGSSLTYRWALYVNTVPAAPILVASGTGATFTRNLEYDVDYIVKWEVEDRCGNVGRVDQTARIRDCKKPGIICQNVNAELMWTGTVGQIDVWASDVLASPITDNCTSDAWFLDYGKNTVVIRADQNPTNSATVAFSRGGSGQSGIDLRKYVRFTCADRGLSVPVQLWSIDSAGNADYCVLNVSVQGNLINAACTGSTARASVAGAIQTETRVNVQNVAVSAYSGATMSGTMMTTNDGQFAIQNLVPGANYQVRANRNDAPDVRDITTFDIALMSQHILGTTPFTSPYTMIAADVDRNGDINGADMIQTRRFVLHLIPAFTNNTSWRFVDKTYTFRDATNPFAEDFREVANLTSVSAAAAANFTAVQTGNVSGWSSATTVRGAAGTLNFNVADMNLVAGKEYTITLSSDQMAQIAGFQGTLNFEKGAVAITNVEGKLTDMNKGNFGVFADAITTSWNGKAGNGDVMSITFIARKAAALSEILSLGSNLTYAEGYNTNGASLNVALKFNGKESADGFALYQNEPNPVGAVTKIAFNLPEASFAKVTISDVSGRVVLEKQGQFTKGYNEIMLNREDFGVASGVLYYRLESNNNTAVRKMVIIK